MLKPKLYVKESEHTLIGVDSHIHKKLKQILEDGISIFKNCLFDLSMDLQVHKLMNS